MPPVNRRRFLQLSAAASLAPGALIGNTKSPAGASGGYMLQMNGYAVNAETPLELLTDYITPVGLFFVRSHWIPRTPTLRQWRLTVDGEIGESLRLSLDDLRKMRVTEATCVLQCAGNGRGLYTPTLPGVQWRYGAVGNARWRGVAVKDVLERAGVKPSAKHLHAFGSDDPPGKVPPFHRSIEMGKALDDAILAYEMNGQPLPQSHGAPLRLVVPGWAGDHWMKWLVRLTVAAARRQNVHLSVCGEMAGDLLAVPILVGLGIDEFSVSPNMIPEVKRVIRSVTFDECRALVRRVSRFRTTAEIEAEIEAFMKAHTPVSAQSSGAHA